MTDIATPAPGPRARDGTVFISYAWADDERPPYDDTTQGWVRFFWAHCAEFPDRVCAMLKERNVETSVPASAWAHDARVKAAVVAAPTTRPDYVVVPHASHFVFVACSGDMAKRAPAICQDAPELDREAFHRELNAAVIAFFKAKLPSP